MIILATKLIETQSFEQKKTINNKCWFRTIFRRIYNRRIYNDRIYDWIYNDRRIYNDARPLMIILATKSMETQSNRLEHTAAPSPSPTKDLSTLRTTTTSLETRWKSRFLERTAMSSWNLFLAGLLWPSRSMATRWSRLSNTTNLEPSLSTPGPERKPWKSD